jgi:putative oxidoreductase
MALFSQLGNYRNMGLFIMRAGIGAMMIFHGLPKLTNPGRWAGLGEAMGVLHIHFLPAFWGFMCAITETVGGLFSVLGLWFRLVSLFMIINFIVASLVDYNTGGLGQASHAIELGFVYIGFLFIGPGKYSVDKS